MFPPQFWLDIAENYLFIAAPHCDIHQLCTLHNAYKTRAERFSTPLKPTIMNTRCVLYSIYPLKHTGPPVPSWVDGGCTSPQNHHTTLTLIIIQNATIALIYQPRHSAMMRDVRGVIQCGSGSGPEVITWCCCCWEIYAQCTTDEEQHLLWFIRILWSVYIHFPHNMADIVN